MRSVVLALAMMASVAVAGRPNARVVLADPDLELRRAMTTALAPWKLEVVIEAGPVDDAAKRAAASNARFVVWREGNDLVVFDRERNETTRRGGKAGTLDPVDAASAALTVKTVMRLPSVSWDGPLEPSPPPGPELRAQAALETRFVKGDVGARAVAGLFAQPFESQLRFGLLTDVGTADNVVRAGFKGQWSNWGLLVAGSYTLVRGAIEVEPYAGAGVGRSTFRGQDMDETRNEHEFLVEFRAGTWVRWRHGMWTFGGGLALDAIPGTPTYRKVNNGSVLYDVPSVAISLGAVVAADLGR